MKRTRKMIAVLLSVLTLLSVISAATPVLAAEVTEVTETESTEATSENAETVESTETENTDNNTEESTETDEPEVLNEMVEWRTESTKYFRNSDGSYTAAQYAYPIHYKENGEWKEIDNSLKEKSVDSSILSSDKVFVAENTNTPATFPDELKQDGSNEISVVADDYTIKFSPKENKKGIKNSDGKVKDREDLDSVKIVEKVNEKQEEKASTFKVTKNTEKAKIKEDKKNEKFKVENKSGAIVYENVFENVNLEYELNNSQIKESIVLNEKQDTYVFSFNMDLGGLYPIMCENGSINLCSDSEGKNPVAKIEAPYMVDSNGEYSDAVTMTIKADGENHILTVTADENWLNDKARVYPVVIDPTIRLDINAAHTYDCYVDSSTPAQALPYNTYLLVGNNSLGTTRAFVKFDLPSLPGDNYLITNASVAYYQYEFDPGSGTTEYMTIHEVTKDWDNADYNVTWNNQPDFEENIVLDYAKFDTTTDDTLYEYRFDVTRTVKEWYEGADNYGFALKLKNETATKRSRMVSAEHPVNDYYPSIFVTFLDNKGIESYWSYSSYSVNNAGAVHINDYTGNLVYELPILSSISEIAQLTLTAYYNNYCANVALCAGKNNSSRTTIGKGFRLNLQQTVLPSTKYGLSGDNAEQYPYVYTDADGTEHYLQQDTEDGKTVYKDEDGLGLTMTTDCDITATYQITDKAHNNYYFNAEGNLSIIQDQNGNRITISYVTATEDDNFRSKTRISKITDGAGHTFTFSYYDTTTGNYVKSITDNAGRAINFETSSGLLRSVTYSNGDVAEISYNISTDNESEGRINNITSNGNYSINLDYTSKATGRRVSKVKEYGVITNSDDTRNFYLGQVVTFDRSKYNTTVIRTPGLDGNHYCNDSTCGDDDIVTTIQFDNFGKPISQQVCLGDGTQSVAGAYNYTEKTVSLASQNKITSAAGLGKNVVNYVKNNSGEVSGNWSEGISESATGNATYSTYQKYIGARSIVLKCDSVTSAGAGVWSYQDITGLVGGRTYILSAYIKVTELESSIPHTNLGASVAIRSLGATSNKTLFSEKITTVSTSDIDNGWRRVSLIMTLPSDATGARIYMELRSVVGTAYFDCISFEVGNSANPCNLLENSSFEKRNSETLFPENWNKIGLIEDTDYVTATKHINGDYSLKIVGDPDEAKRVYQKVPVHGDINDTYIVSGWAMANAVNTTYHSTVDDKGTDDTEDDETTYHSFFEIHIKVFYDDGNGGTYEEEKPAAKFNTTINGWQYTAQAISLKSTEYPKYKPTEIRIMPRYNNQANVAYFDHIQLIKDVAQSYTYDDEGNAISVSANAEQEINTKYDDNNNLTSYKDVLKNETTLKYDSKNNLTVTKSPKGVYSENFYNSTGNITAQETRSSATTNTGRIIRTDKTYYGSNSTYGIKANAYLKTASDEHGYETTYTHDWKTGKPKTVTNALGTKTTYSYTGTYDTLEKVSAGEAFVKYTYDKDRLTDILFESNGGGNSETYSFTYDNFGNVEETKVGDKTLSSNTYGSRNGQLIKTTYENTDALENTYDELGNLKKVIGTDSGTSDTLYTWAYNSAGVTTAHRDYENAKRYFYYYDSIGRLIQTEIRTNSNENHTHLGAIKYEYDLRDNLKSVTMDLGGKSVPVQKYGYAETKDQKGVVIEGSKEDGADNLPTRYNLTSTRYVDYEHDSLNRLNKKTLTTENPFVTSYTYKSSARNTDGGTIYRTTQLSTETIGGTKYGYTYDKVGNITAIKKNDGAYRSYEYDSMSQLTRENYNGTNNSFTKFWNYDSIGNIESVKTYKCTTTATGSLTGALTGIDYQYSTDSSTGWDRLLTKLVYKTYNSSGGVTKSETKTIDYDEIGNPVSYLDHDMSWFGRQLKTINVGANTTETTDDKTISFTYGADGLRGTKTVTTGGNTVKSEYVYANGLLAYEKCGNSELFFFYDSYDHLAAIRYYPDATGTDYKQCYVITNSMGDVIAFVDGNGKIIGSYEYDAWGNCTITSDTSSTNITELNPIRYRGYYFDSETGFYYLQSRYYDPEIGRFLNADTIDVLSVSPTELTDKNLFSYCDNNPVAREDITGDVWETAFDIASLGVSVIEVAINPTDVWAWAGLVGDAVDLIPFVTGVGEITRGIKLLNKTDDVIDTAKSIKRSVNNASGTYEILYKSGKNYVGKGNFDRAITSAIEHAKPNRLNNNMGDVVTSIKWRQSKNSTMAFMEEYALQTQRGVKNSMTYNLIWSPGKNYYSRGLFK